MRAQEAWYLARQAERGFASRLRGLLATRDSHQLAGRVSTDKRACIDWLGRVRTGRLHEIAHFMTIDLAVPPTLSFLNRWSEPLF